MKIFFRRIHLYLALAAGLVIMVACLTGAILVFEKDLQQAFHKERYFTTAQQQRLSEDSLIKNLKAHVPGAKISGIKVYSEPTRTTEVVFTEKKAGERKPGEQKQLTGKKPKGKRDEPARLVAYMDPYSGQVIELYNHKESFFYWVMDAHRWLLAGETGKLITGIATLIFLVILITGIILWWPKNKHVIRKRLTMKWDGGWKRINHDIHIVLGFYSSILLFIFAFTALAWSFEWFNKGIYTVTGTTMERPKAPKNEPANPGARLAISTVIGTVKADANHAVYFNVGIPKDSTEVFTVTVLPVDAPHETASDTYYVGQYEPKIISHQAFSERNLGQRVRASFKPIHTSSYFGMTSKVIGCIICLLGFIFPVTGYIMWFNRVRKKKSNGN